MTKTAAIETMRQKWRSLFMVLLQQGTYPGKPSVTELAGVAGVSRGSFFNNCYSGLDEFYEDGVQYYETLLLQRETVTGVGSGEARLWAEFAAVSAGGKEDKTFSAWVASQTRGSEFGEPVIERKTERQRARIREALADLGYEPGGKTATAWAKAIAAAITGAEMDESEFTAIVTVIKKGAPVRNGTREITLPEGSGLIVVAVDENGPDLASLAPADREELQRAAREFDAYLAEQELPRAGQHAGL